MLVLHVPVNDLLVLHVTVNVLLVCVARTCKRYAGNVMLVMHVPGHVLLVLHVPVNVVLVLHVPGHVVLVFHVPGHVVLVLHVATSTFANLGQSAPLCLGGKQPRYRRCVPELHDVLHSDQDCHSNHSPSTGHGWRLHER